MKRLGLLFICILQFSCNSQKTKKINGVSFVGSRDKATQENVNPILKVNANFAAIMPFGFTKSLEDSKVVYNTERQWFGETVAGGKQYIELLQQNNIKIMLKPQIWVWHGEFTGDIKMNTEEDWQQLERSYSEFILTYAQLAQEMQVAIYCIGTELDEFVKARPNYWSDLIVEVRKIYKGKLTYAANWDEYSRTPFWKNLDFIGIDAYFPLSESQYPSKKEMTMGWQKWKTKLENLSGEIEKPILFTEFGYRSMDYTAKKPWLVDRNEMAVNLTAQADALEVTFEEFWNEDWFAGGFVWKWFLHHDEVGGKDNNRFTPQNKPAENTIQKYYNKF